MFCIVHSNQNPTICIGLAGLGSHKSRFTSRGSPLGAAILALLVAAVDARGRCTREKCRRKKV
jgi:hypothetical protein